jgi:hypothetical protein
MGPKGSVSKSMVNPREGAASSLFTSLKSPARMAPRRVYAQFEGVKDLYVGSK